MLRPVPGLILLLLLLFIPFVVAPPGQAAAAGYLEELIERSRRLGLAQQRQWLKLGHYEPAPFGFGLVSVIDSGNFFNAANGRRNPAAELEATLAAFFAPPPGGDDEQHPQCAFIARYHWLKSELGFDPARLAERACPRFEAWYGVIDPGQVTLVLPAAYMNQPSSMFGHTLLRIDRPNQSARTRLTSYAINYGADTGGDGGVPFAIKGIFGGYRGAFTLMPYYEKVKDYSDLENRDIWEYELDLSPEEIRRMLRHVWELDNVWADYYFFDENCSYQLLSLIEVARPGLDLTGGFGWWAIPTDTVKVVVAEAGLLKRTVFRPSARGEINHRAGLLQPRLRRLAQDMTLGRVALDDARIEGLTDTDKAAVLELAYEFLQFRFRADDETRDVVAPRSMALLRARSQLPKAEPVAPVPEPETRPDQGHASARAGLGGGVIDGDFFQEINIRASYHDLLDPPGGFVRGFEIEALHLRLRHFDDDRDVELESFQLVGIQSSSPRNDFFKPISWRFDLGAEKFRRGGDADQEIVGVVGGGAGLSFGLGTKAIASAFADLRLFAGQNLDDQVAVAVGPSLGLHYYPTGWWALGLEATYQYSADDETDHYLDVGLTQGFALGRSFGLRLTTAMRGPFDERFFEFGGTLYWYF